MRQGRSPKSHSSSLHSADTVQSTTNVMRPLDEHEVAERAYLHWIERGCPENSAEEDWFEAERELRLVKVAGAGAK
jgi:hypothetical protein